MKLFGLYEHENIEALQANHRKFCNVNNAEYRSYRVANYYEKYRLIYQIMQENPEEILLFIDSNSYFTTFEWKFSTHRDLLLQEKDGSILDNFIALRNTREIQKIFKNYILPATGYQMSVLGRWEFKHPSPPVPAIPKENLLAYPYKQEGIHINIDAFAHYNDSEVLVRRIYLGTFQYPDSFANLLCNYQPSTYQINELPFEVINPHCKRALVTIYTQEIKQLGAISEHNLSTYCKRNGITYYVYREIPHSLRHISGAWCKPYLLLNHIDHHEYIGWIDSDVLISPDYCIDFSHDIRVYNDPGDWYFNSGFMIYKNTHRNKHLLHGVIRRCDQLQQRHLTHINGGDQTYFIQEYKERYPDLLPLSNLETNCLPGFPLPDKKPQLIHFMGIRMPIRIALMDATQQQFENQEKTTFLSTQ
jgi:hypothetical protein